MLSGASCLTSWACHFRCAMETRRVPAADNGPALTDLIAKEIARHEANLVNTLNQRDRDDQQEALRSPSTYI